MLPKYTEVPNHTWWKRAKNNKTYYVGDVSFGNVWLMEIYKTVPIKITVQEFLLQANSNNFRQYNEDGTLQV